MKKRLKLWNRSALIRLSILLGIIIIFLSWGWKVMIWMPGQSYRDALPPLTLIEEQLQQELQRDIQKIAGEIGEHNYIKYDNLLAVADFLETSFQQAGYQVNSQEYRVNNQSFRNLEVEIIGSKKPEEIVIIGAHYDSVFASPGANDNGTGTAAVLALARKFADKKPEKTLRFVEFVNEEPPFFWTENMGSWVYAKRCRQRNENIVAMLSLETIGYYSDQPGSQTYPMGLLDKIYPITGNFLSFVGNFSSANLVKNVIGNFREHTQFPSEGAILPNAVAGAGWSDHWSFWQEGYPALMITDTAPFRYPFYHTIDDKPEQINYNKLARVVSGLERVINHLQKR